LELEEKIAGRELEVLLTQIRVREEDSKREITNPNPVPIIGLKLSI
jgi:hypothetical protein